MKFDYLRHNCLKSTKFEAIETNDCQYLMKRLKKLEGTRHLSLWHDHSAVLSRGTS